MTEEQVPRDVSEVEELVKLVHLEDIYTLEFSGTRHFPQDEAQRVDALTEAETAQYVQMSRVQLRESPEGLDARFQIRVSLPDLTGFIDIVTAYSFSEPINAIEPARQEFVERIASLAVWPYIREAVSSLAVRLRVSPITLPMLRQGDVTLAKIADTELSDRDSAPA